jgi:hypothetical protein
MIPELLERVKGDIEPLIRRMLGQPYQRPTIAELIQEIDELKMWRIAETSTKKYWIYCDYVSRAHLSIVDNHIKHKKMPFGLPMPTAKEIFGGSGVGDHWVNEVRPASDLR